MRKDSETTILKIILFAFSCFSFFLAIFTADDDIVGFIICVFFGFLPLFFIKNFNILFKNKFSQKNNDNDFLKQFEEKLKFDEIEKHELLKEKYRELSKLEKSEYILDYTHSLCSDYMGYEGLTDWIKSMDFKDRMWYIINSCNLSNPSIQEIYLLTLAYDNLGSLYNEYTIYYAELYLNGGFNFYNKRFSKCNTQNDVINFQWCLFHFILAKKYKEDLDFEKALKNAFASKGMSDNFTKPYYTNIGYDDYGIISEILYKKGNIDAAILNLKEGLSRTNVIYLKERYSKLLNKYNDYKKNNKIYIIKNTQRLRIDMKTKNVYNLTTGEIIEEKG